jgi:hypothetical protein
MDELRRHGRAGADGDARALYRAAHTLRSSFGIFGARGALDLAEQTERLAREGRMSEAATSCAALEDEVNRLRTALAELVAETEG